MTGFTLWPQLLSKADQEGLVEAVWQTLRQGPLYRPVTPGGRTMSVETTNLGPLGWFSDRSGYRYTDRHPTTGEPWPSIPQALLDLWAVHGDPRVAPDACLVNLYRGAARMGLHQDRDEADFSFPVLSVSLGDTAIFRWGGATRGGATQTVRLASGDVCRLAGEARLAYHGIDRILPGSSRLIPGGGRLNLTLRRAARP